MGHPWRFEQLCRATGTCASTTPPTAWSGGAELGAAPGDSTRSQAARPRLASCAVSQWPGFGLHRLSTPDRRQAHLQRGILFDGEGQLAQLEAPWLRTLSPPGEKVPCILETDTGRTVRLEAETVLATFVVLPPEIGGGLQLNQSIVRYTWDGECANGMMEQ